MDLEYKCRLLEGLTQIVSESGSGEDEENLLPNFLPLRSYSRLADQKNFLVTGGRGSGKTELFHILTSCGGLNYILSEKDKGRHTKLRESEFLIGYIATGTGAKSFPTASVCDDFLKYEDAKHLISFWGGLACAVILQRFSDEKEIIELADLYLGEETKCILINKSSEISMWWKLLDTKKEKWESFLDQVDAILEKKEKFICLTYDELDRICGNYRKLFGYIRSLLDFWYRHNRRYNNIKAKIFLRNDLYQAEALQFADASKIGAYRLKLTWDVRSLYQLLIKRMANTGVTELEAYLKGVPDLLQPIRKGELGYLPGDSEEAFRLLVDRMIGPYMGKNAKRGGSYQWVPNHIQDANGELMPRAFLRCFSFAAEGMLNYKNEIAALERERILSPTRLQGAVARVSVARVQELTQEEYRWLKNLIRRLNGKHMLMELDEFLSYLQPEQWPETERTQLPGKTGMEILDGLLTLGIVMKTADGRINVPEIYLHGFGLKRKGGIKRPK